MKTLNIILLLFFAFIKSVIRVFIDRRQSLGVIVNLFNHDLLLHFQIVNYQVRLIRLSLKRPSCFKLRVLKRKC